MRYLRMLSNSVAAAMLASAYVVIVILALNPQMSLAPDRLLPLLSTAGIYYSIHVAVGFYLLLVARQLLAAEVFSPAWISIGVLVWLSAGAAAAGAAIMFLNANVFALVLQADTARRMTSGAYALATASVLFVAIAILRAGTGRRGKILCAVLLVIVGAGSIGAPLALRGRGVQPLLGSYPIDLGPDVAAIATRPKVTIVALDGASLDFISTATSEGRLPNFGRLLDGGATVHLATLRPTSAEVVWAAVATGKLPQKNGVRSAAAFRIGDSPETIELLPDYVYAHGLLRFGFLREEPYSTATLRARAIWSILSSSGVQVGVVGWPLTHPAPVVRGFVVSDEYLRQASMPSGIDEPSGVYPRELQTQIGTAIDGAALAPPVVAASEPGRLEVDNAPARTDRAYDRIARALDAERPAQVLLVRYRSLDAIGHVYLRYAMPSEFGDVTDEERRRFDGVLEQHYRAIDEAVGRMVASVGADDLLLVVSPYGMEPLGLGKRLLERVAGDPEISGTHDAAPDGFLIAYGSRVGRGRRASRASVVDVAPTVLYYLGLPVGRDMDGAVRTDLFQRSFTEERPITFIPTYDR